MQVQSLRIPSYRRFKVDDTLPAAAVKRRHKLETYRDLRAEGCSQQTALRAIGWSRATYFRWAARYRKCGPHGLAAISRRPQRTRPRQWTPAHAAPSLDLAAALSLHGQATSTGSARPPGHSSQ